MRMKMMRKMLVLPALAAAMLAVNASPAGAVSAAAAVVQGGGSISPGLSAVPEGQTFNFTSVDITTAGVVDNAASVGSSNCTANGGSLIPENTLAGAGTGTWSCSTGPLAGEGGSLIYVRATAAVGVVLTGSLTGALACGFVPGEGQNGVTVPVTSYSLTCVGAGAQA